MIVVDLNFNVTADIQTVQIHVNAPAVSPSQKVRQPQRLEVLLKSVRMTGSLRFQNGLNQSVRLILFKRLSWKIIQMKEQNV